MTNENEADDPRTVWEMREGWAVPIGPAIKVTVVSVGRRPVLAIDAPGDVRVGPVQRPDRPVPTEPEPTDGTPREASE